MIFPKNLVGPKKNNIEKFSIKTFKVLTNLLKKNNKLIFYQVNFLIFKFNIIISKELSSKIALNSFYWIKEIKKLDNRFKIFVLNETIIKIKTSDKLKIIETSNNVYFQNNYGLIQFLNFTKKIGLFYISKKENLKYWDIYNPFRFFVHLISMEFKCIQIHAGSILYKKKGILLLGNGGVGKSTSVINSINNYNCKTVGDDYLLISSKTKKAYPIYRTVKLKKNFYKILSLTKNNNINLINEKKIISIFNDINIKNKFSNGFKINKIISINLSENSSLRSLLKSTIEQMPFRTYKTVNIAIQFFKKFKIKNININHKKNLYLKSLKQILET
jgi:sulfopyruvate decarboxylase TPP-binding subunit